MQCSHTARLLWACTTRWRSRWLPITPAWPGGAGFDLPFDRLDRQPVVFMIIDRVPGPEHPSYGDFSCDVPGRLLAATPAPTARWRRHRPFSNSNNRPRQALPSHHQPQPHRVPNRRRCAARNQWRRRRPRSRLLASRASEADPERASDVSSLPRRWRAGSSAAVMAYSNRRSRRVFASTGSKHGTPRRHTARDARLVSRLGTGLSC